MLLHKFLTRRRLDSRHISKRRLNSLNGAVAVTCEGLESRRLLATFVYTVPLGHTAAFIQPLEGGLPRQVQVRLDDPINGTIEPEGIFLNDTGQDIIQVQQGVSGFKFVNQVPAALMPFPDPQGHTGIKVRGGTGNTFMLDEKGPIDTLPGNVDDTLIEVLEFTETAVVVNTFGLSVLGGGVDHLFIRTNDVVADDFHPFGGTDVIVPSLSSGIHLTVDTGLGTFDRITLGQNNTIAEQVIVKTGAGNSIVDLQQANGDDGTNALIDFTGGQLGLGNKLLIHSVGSATLALAPGNQHTIYVDEVIASGAAFDKRGTLIVEDPSVIGNLQLASFSTARIQGTTTITAVLVASGATAFIEAQTTVEGTFDVDGPDGLAEFTADATVDNFDDSGGTVNVLAGADVIVENQSSINELNVVGTGASVLFKDADAQSATVNRVTNLTITDGGLVTIEQRAGSLSSDPALVT